MIRLWSRRTQSGWPRLRGCQEALKEEYASGSEVFLSKIESLAAAYRGVRRARGDGNCFFRSFIFGFLEKLIERSNRVELDRFRDLLRDVKGRLLENGYQELVIEDPMEVLEGVVGAICREDSPLTVEGLLEKMRQQDVSEYIVLLMRLIVSCHIRQHHDFFAPFIMGMSDEGLSVEKFCEKHVEPMGVESDHIHIVAIQNAFQVPIRVAYLDNSTAGAAVGSSGSLGAVTYHDFFPDNVPSHSPTVHLLYRPGHYDILYEHL
uniref:ubiquitinyl hydrolase 1 n=1 Tax=Tetraselmis sp. GSL018 TaxID=582737 RepID=A0A061QL51_9CHLO